MRGDGRPRFHEEDVKGSQATAQLRTCPRIQGEEARHWGTLRCPPTPVPLSGQPEISGVRLLQALCSTVLLRPKAALGVCPGIRTTAIRTFAGPAGRLLLTLVGGTRPGSFML